MRKDPPAGSRKLTEKRMVADLCVVGGGMAGVCCSITAARLGLNVVLVTDRPVLGGNASSEVRLWVLGATAHMTSNNRWAREGGVIDELLVENLYRNPDGNAIIFDTILLEKVAQTPNITLLLNTSIDQVQKGRGDAISSVSGFCSQNSVRYHLSAPLFCDASGDGVVGFLSGAAFRMGAEARDEFGEKFAPSEQYGELLGHSMYFYSKDVGRPVKFTAPSFALRDITAIPRYRRFDSKTHGCRLWWIEYGGRLNTVEDTEQIKWELWKVVYGVWDYIKNSGKFPDTENMTLEWVSHIPGKRESRRFEGDYILTQQDVVDQRTHADAVAFGGWSIDLHPADGVYSELPGCDQWHSRGIYQIPYRCLYSRNVSNLFLAGRIISCSHVAFGTTRVMATCALTGQAVATAAAICTSDKCSPRDAGSGDRLARLQRTLARMGHFVPGAETADEEDLTRSAEVAATSSFSIDSLPRDGDLLPIGGGVAQMLPLAEGACPAFTIYLTAEQPFDLDVQLRSTMRPGNFTPDVILEKKIVTFPAGDDVPVLIKFDSRIMKPGYYYLTLAAPQQKKASVRLSRTPVTGLVSIKYGRTQAPETDNGTESFEIWRPDRSMLRQNLALDVSPALQPFGAGNVTSGVSRPYIGPNAWVASPADKEPALTLSWKTAQTVRQIIIECDCDFDHPMESVLHGHAERAIPMCVSSLSVQADGVEIASVAENHQTRVVVTLPQPVTARNLVIRPGKTHGTASPSLFGVRVFGSAVEDRAVKELA